MIVPKIQDEAPNSAVEPPQLLPQKSAAPGGTTPPQGSAASGSAEKNADFCWEKMRKPSGIF